MESAIDLHRLHFAFTIIFHYLFVQLSLGLALIIVIFKTIALRTGDEHYNRAARFWGKIFGINFALSVVTGIPMEFQFGTNWSAFSKTAGGVVGQMLAMQGVFSFFLESTFLGLFLLGEKRLGPRLHWLAAFLVFAGSWLSGYFIVAANSWMQNPVGYTIGPAGEILLTSVGALLTNPWLFWQYTHTVLGSVVTGGIVVSSIGAFYLIGGRHEPYGRTFVKTGVLAAIVAAYLVAFPTGDQQAVLMYKDHPATYAAMQGIFDTEEGGALALIGQPNMREQKLDNPIRIPNILGFLTYQRWKTVIRGLNEFPEENWPTNVPLLYYSYRIMVGLAAIFIVTLSIAAPLLSGGLLYRTRPMLWALLLLLPFPYIANTAGWLTAETGRQPWVIYGLMRTAEGASSHVSAGNVLFTLIGFMGMYTALGILFLFLASRLIGRGP